jgi:hypothetical protein
MQQNLTRLRIWDCSTKASSLLVVREIARAGAQSEDVEATRSIMGSYKQFVQLAMATEEWDSLGIKSWQTVLKALLSSSRWTKGVFLRGLDLLHNPFFGGIERQYFASLALYKFNFLSALESLNEQVPEEHHQTAMQAGLF